MKGTKSASLWVRRWFRGAALYGAVALLLAAFAPPPAVGQLEHYGFVFTALAFQGVFWVIGGDPARYRALMPFAVAEKLAFGMPCAILFSQGAVDAPTLGFGVIDLLLGLGFVLAWRATARG